MPREVNRVMSLHPVPTYISWRLGGEKLINIDANYSKLYVAEDAVSEAGYIPEETLEWLRTLPVTSTWMSGIDPETVLDLEPDLILTLTQDTNADQLQETTGIPVVCIVKAPVTDQAGSYRLVGQLLGNEEEGNEMADFVQGIMDRVDAEVSQMADEDKYTVMFAGSNGSPDLHGVPGANTVYATTLTAAGGINVSDELDQVDNQTITVTTEQIMTWDPDVIVCQTVDMRDELMNSEEFSGLSAVQNGQVYVPLQYTSCDGMAAVLGIEWMNCILYHSDDDAAWQQLYDDMYDFHQLFYGLSLTDEQLRTPSTGW